MIRHLVVFNYRQTATPDQVREITDAFRGLKDRIPGITAFEHGSNCSAEGKDLGFTHAHLLTFVDAHARDAYLPHPEHRRFVERLERLGIVKKVFVFDYEPEP